MDLPILRFPRDEQQDDNDGQHQAGHDDQSERGGARAAVGREDVEQDYQ